MIEPNYNVTFLPYANRFCLMELKLGLEMAVVGRELKLGLENLRGTKLQYSFFSLPSS
jgi:hypothetical protein